MGTAVAGWTLRRAVAALAAWRIEAAPRRRRETASSRRSTETTLTLRRAVAWRAVIAWAVRRRTAVAALALGRTEGRRVPSSRCRRRGTIAAALPIRIEAAAPRVSHHGAAERIHAGRAVAVLWLGRRTSRMRLGRKRLGGRRRVLIGWSAGRRMRWSRARWRAVSARRRRRHAEHGALQWRPLRDRRRTCRWRSARRRSRGARRRSTRSAGWALRRVHHQHGPLELGGSRAF